MGTGQGYQLVYYTQKHYKDISLEWIKEINCMVINGKQIFDGKHTVTLTWHTSKVMLKILQVRLQQYMNRELPDVQTGFRKGRGTRDQIANICWIIKKAREFKNNIYFCFIDYGKPLTVWITINCGKLWKTWEYQTIWPVSWETYMQVREQQLELDMEQQTDSK